MTNRHGGDGGTAAGASAACARENRWPWLSPAPVAASLLPSRTFRGVSDCFLGGVVAYAERGQRHGCWALIRAPFPARSGERCGGRCHGGACARFGADSGLPSPASPVREADGSEAGRARLHRHCGEGHAEVHRRQFSGDRDEVRQHAVRCALALAADFVENEPKQNHASRDTGPKE